MKTKEADELRKLMKEAYEMDGGYEEAYDFLIEGIDKIIDGCEE